MFCEKAKKTADACRFCWMCRHLCPIGLKTGKEINTARAKGLLVSLCERGQEFDCSVAEAMWECCLCGACANDCATGYDPKIFIREARSAAVAGNIAPDYVCKVMENIFEKGNIYGVASKGGFKNGLPEKAEVLLYIGEVASISAPLIARAVISLMKKAGVSFTVLENEPSTGAYAGDLIGFVEEVREMGVKASAAISESGAKTVVVLDPTEARMMKHEYAEWNISPAARIVTATSFIAELIEKGKLKPAKSDISVTLHDAGALARELDETEPARNILAAAGIEIKEMFLTKKLAKSSGGALLQVYSPRLSALTAEGRWEDAVRTGAKIMVTEAPGSYSALLPEAPEGYELTDIFARLDSLCK